MNRRIKGATTACSLLLFLLTSTASAQTAGPYAAGLAGISGGDTGPSFAAGAAVGYMGPQRLGFELEIGVAPGLEFEDVGLLRIRPALLTSLFPAPTRQATGRVLTFQSNVVAVLTRQGNVQVSIVGGGGVANRQQDITWRYPEIVFPGGFPTLPTFPFTDLDPLQPFPFPFPLDFEIREQRTSRSDNALCLNAGGIVAYALSSPLTVGADVRYTHAFFSVNPWDAARVTARLRWQF